MGMSDKREIAMEGYLDVKYPPGCPERKRWKVWHRSWVTAKVLETSSEERGNVVSLQISDHSPTQQHFTKNPTILWKAEIRSTAKIFRSHSGSRLQRTFGITQSINQDQGCPKVLIYLAGEDERQAQHWMEALRNAILPPSPPENPSQTRYSISLIDDISSFNQGLLGTYGYLITMPSSIGILHPHFGHCIAKWPLSLMQEGKLIRSDRDSSSNGVVAFNLKTRSKLRESQQLCFYSPEAKIITLEINKIIRSSKQVNNGLSLTSNSKSKSNLKKKNSNNEKIDIQPTSTENDGSSNAFTSAQENYNALSSTSNLKMTSEVSSNFLNCSISSTFQCTNNLNSSSDESDYSPPISPLRSDFCGDSDSATTDKNHNGQDAQTHQSQIELNSDYLHNESIHPAKALHSAIYTNDVRRLSKFSIDSHVYADVMISHTRRQYSIGSDTLYEELLDSPTEINVQADEELYVPPLPPPRCPAKRPNTLRLKQLSESVENTLVTLQKVSPTQSTAEKKSAVNTLWGNPLKGVKKILGKDRKAKSEQSSPVKDSPKKQQNGPKMKSKELEDILTDIRSTSSEENETCPADCQHLITETSLPVPFLPVNTKTLTIPESTISFPTGRKHSWSVDSLQLGDFKRKHSCLRHLLKHLENKSNGYDDIPCYCSCPSSNQNNTPIASPKTSLHFSRRQSKSLSADIEKHFRGLHSHADKKTVKKGLFISSYTANGQNQNPMDDYCPMGFAPRSQEKPLVNGKIHHLVSEDPLYEYIDMDMSKGKGH